ncbi:MAG TPA: hypothetical protein PK581_00805 [Caldisericia bacterium]|nr:hypothetical protein [Caldisericia bacterium]
MPSKKEAAARIKINRLLEEAGWRFEENEHGSANIQLEVSVKTYQSMGDDFENAQSFKVPRNFKLALYKYPILLK